MTVIQNIYQTITGAMNANLTSSAVSIALALLLYIGWAMYGYKAMRVFSSLFGFGFGIVGGFFIVNVAKLQGYWVILVPVIGAVLFTTLGFFLFKAGLFGMELALTVSVVYPILVRVLTLDTLILGAIAVLIGLVISILSMVIYRPAIILVSAVTGGMGFSSVLFTRLVDIRWNEQSSMMAVVIVAVVIAVFGMVYQFRSTK